MKKSLTRTFSIISVVTIAIYSLLVGLVTPKLIQDKLIEIINIKLNTSATIEKITLNPFTFELDIYNLNIPNVSNNSRFKFDHLYLDLEIIPLLKKEISLQNFTLSNAEILFEIYKNKKTNWNFTKDNSKSSSKENNWILKINKLNIEKNKFIFNDLSFKDAVYLPIGPFSLVANNISTKINSLSSLENLNINLGNNGKLNLSGKFKTQPINIDFKYKAVNIPLNSISSFLSNSTIIKIISGDLSSSGELKYQNSHFNLVSNASINNLNLKANNKEILSFQKTNIDLISIDSLKNSIELGTINTEELKTNIKLNHDGTLNLRQLTRQKNDPSEKDQKGKTKLAYNLKEIIFLNSELDFFDEQIKPNFSAHIKKIKGIIGPISSVEKNNINIHLEGFVEDQGKFKAKGNYIQNHSPSDLNLDVNFKNIEMTTFTPYSGHFAGYEIKKGKLFLELNYKIKNNKIIGSNNVILDNFFLGNKVEGENSTNLPLKLALALLRDRKDQIKFKLPVEGSTNNPTFSYGSFIRTALFNMIVNIAMSPFDFIKDTLGTGPEIKNISFNNLTDQLALNESNKIEKIINVLNDRPQLKIDILGTVSYKEFDPKLTNEQRNKILSPENMRSIGLQRAQFIQNMLAERGISPERLYVLSGKINDDDKGPSGVTLIFKAD